MSELFTPIDLSTVEEIEFDGIDHSDYPDYCDAYIVSATINGRQASDDELEELNDNSEFVYDKLMDYLH